MTERFKLKIDESVLDDLKAKIRATRWPDAIDKPDWKYGVNLSYMIELASYWLNSFDWRKTEEMVNNYPQYVVEIDGHRIHYLHIKSKGQHPIPLLISHGWPGSFMEMLKIIHLLTEPGDLTFDLVIPSLIGFGFSEKPDSEISTSTIAGFWVKLMTGLGYNKFIAQGGDFGAIISTRIALKHPENLMGLHLNYIPFNYKPFLRKNERLTPEEIKAQQKAYAFFQAEGAYAQIQTTKPLTLSYGLNDSPVGLCAWILQIFKSFSNPHLAIEDIFDKDELLANVTLYWLTGTIYSSMLLYRASMNEPLTFKEKDFVKIPVGIAHYPYPDSFPARKYIERGYNVIHWKDMPVGGHFAAMEQPKLFADNIKEFAEYVLE